MVDALLNRLFKGCGSVIGAILYLLSEGLILDSNLKEQKDKLPIELISEKDFNEDLVSNQSPIEKSFYEYKKLEPFVLKIRTNTGTQSPLKTAFKQSELNESRFRFFFHKK